MVNKVLRHASLWFVLITFSSQWLLVQNVAATEVPRQEADGLSAESEDDDDDTASQGRPQLIRQKNIASWQIGVSYLQNHPHEVSYTLSQHGPWLYEVRRESERFYGHTYYQGKLKERSEIRVKEPFAS